jgi:hypothetical protein
MKTTCGPQHKWGICDTRTQFEWRNLKGTLIEDGRIVLKYKGIVQERCRDSTGLAHGPMAALVSVVSELNCINCCYACAVYPLPFPV